MRGRGANDLRWFLVLPVAVAAAAVAQLAFTAPAHGLVHALTPAETGGAWWYAKAVASPFMGAAFVAGAWFTAPDAREVAAKMSVGAAGVWGLWLIVSAVGGSGSLWPAALGVLGLAGAVVAAWALPVLHGTWIGG